MNTKSEKEIYAYFKRVEDPANYSSERWGYLIEQWMLHGSSECDKGDCPNKP